MKSNANSKPAKSAEKSRRLTLPEAMTKFLEDNPNATQEEYEAFEAKEIAKRGRR